MNYQISTGQVVGAAPTSGASSTLGANVLFGATSTSVTSRMVCIAPGEALVVTGHGLREAHAVARRVFYKPGVLPTVDPCDPCYDRCFKPDPGTITGSKESAVNCLTTSISECNDTAAITLPGCYVFELDDASVIGSAYIEFEKMPVGLVPTGIIAVNATAPKISAVIEVGGSYKLVYDDGTITPLETTI